MSIIIREAVAEDVLPIQHFIARAGFPATDTHIDWEKFYLATNHEEEIVATVALEPVTERDTMIRTLIIDSNKVNGSFLLKILETAYQLAVDKGAETVYLVAANAEDVLLTLDFQKVIAFAEVPEEIRRLPNVPDHHLSSTTLFKKSTGVDK